MVPSRVQTGASRDAAEMVNPAVESQVQERHQPGTRDVYAPPGPRPEAVSTAAPLEYYPGVVYVQNRLKQMMVRSQDELEPYPPAWLIQSAWSRAWPLVLPGMPTPSVVPSEEGNVAFVWHKRGWDAEVEFAPTETDVWAASLDGSSTVEGTTGQALESLITLLRQLEADHGIEQPG